MKTYEVYDDATGTWDVVSAESEDEAVEKFFETAEEKLITKHKTVLEVAQIIRAARRVVKVRQLGGK